MTAPAEFEATVGFVDLAGFTALTDAHGDRAALDLVVRFEAMIRDGIDGDGRLVKTIGDAAMVTFEDPTRALTGLGSALDALAVTEHFPLARTGLHHGSVLERDGDLFGATVNLAARVAGQAAGGQVPGTAAVERARTRSIRCVGCGSSTETPPAGCAGTTTTTGSARCDVRRPSPRIRPATRRR